MNHRDLQSAIERRDAAMIDALAGNPDADEALEAEIADEIDRIAARCGEDPAEADRVIDRCEVDLSMTQVRIHGEVMCLQRAWLELAHMIRRHDDADAIRVVEADIRTAIVDAIAADVTVQAEASAAVLRRRGL